MKINEIINETPRQYKVGDPTDAGSGGLGGQGPFTTDPTAYFRFIQNLKSVGIEVDPKLVALGLTKYQSGLMSPDEAYDAAKRQYIDTQDRAELQQAIQQSRRDMQIAIQNQQKALTTPGINPPKTTPTMNLPQGRQRGWNDETHGHLRKQYRNSSGVSFYDFLSNLRQAVTLDTRDTLSTATSGFNKGANLITRLSGKTK